jgi:uncharacterized protein YndB with AHSA1/START domain
MGQTSKTSSIIKTTPEILYQALTTPKALEVWQAPDSMTGKVHTFDLRVGGGYEMSLFYPESEKGNAGKTNGKEDRFTVRFLELIPYQKIVEAVTFSSDDPDFSGEMRIGITLEPKDNGTEITHFYENIPKGIRPEDNDAGTRSSLEKLARYVEVI